MSSVLSASLKSTNTTIVAALVFGQVLLAALVAVMDGNAETAPDWNGVINTAMIAIGLFLARDADKSSEKVGIK